MRKIYLTQGKVALVDDEDYEMLNQYTWYYNKGYAGTNIRCPVTNKRKALKMHQLLNPDYTMTDHIDRNGINNQRANLREATRSMNTRNSPKHKGTSSKYRGISWNKNANKWQANIQYNGKPVYLGLYDDEEEAHEAYILFRIVYAVDTVTIFTDDLEIEI